MENTGNKRRKSSKKNKKKKIKNKDSMSDEERFSEFVKYLKPSRDFVKQRRKWLQDKLIRAPEVKQTFLNGSYARHTDTNPLHDIDIFIVLRLQKKKVNNKPLVDHLISILKKNETLGNNWEENGNGEFLVTVQEIGKQLVVRKQSCSIGICWGTSWEEKTTTFDLVPAIKQNKGYYIWNKSGLTYTNPRETIALLKEDKKMNPNLSNLVRLAKTWNVKQKTDKGKDSKPFESFHLEVLCHKFVKENDSSNLYTAMVNFFEFLVKNFGVPLPTPGDDDQLQQIDINGEWSKNDIKSVVEDALAIAKSASEAKEGEAYKHWQKLFKECF